MEDKSEELKREYSKLHERYTELFKTHMDYLERTKILMGTDRLDQLLPGSGGNARNRMSGFNMGRFALFYFLSCWVHIIMGTS